MEKLKLLSSLEELYNLISEYEDEKEQLSDRFLNENKKDFIRNIEININSLKNKNQITKEKLKQIEKSLKEYNFTAKEIEDRLYNGNIKDIKQLELLSNEKNQIKIIIDRTESNLLNNMEEIGINEENLMGMDINLEDIRNKNNENEIKYIGIDKELDSQINRAKDEIKNISSSLDKNILDIYYNIRKNKNTALTHMENGICTTCNMRLSTSIAEKIKENNSIIYCENCGRIILCKLNL